MRNLTKSKMLAAITSLPADKSTFTVPDLMNHMRNKKETKDRSTTYSREWTVKILSELVEDKKIDNIVIERIGHGVYSWRQPEIIEEDFVEEILDMLKKSRSIMLIGEPKQSIVSKIFANFVDGGNYQECKMENMLLKHYIAGAAYCWIRENKKSTKNSKKKKKTVKLTDKEIDDFIKQFPDENTLINFIINGKKLKEWLSSSNGKKLIRKTFIKNSK